MGAISKSGKGRSAARKRASKPSGRKPRRRAGIQESWEQAAEVPYERDDEIDCQRIVQGDGCRRQPVYYDDYN